MTNALLQQLLYHIHMTFGEYTAFFSLLFGALPISILDIVFVLLLLLFSYSEKNNPVIKSCHVFISSILISLVTLFLYPYVSELLTVLGILDMVLRDMISISICIASFIGLGYVIYQIVMQNITYDLAVKKIPIVSCLLGGIAFVIISTWCIHIILAVTFPLSFKNKITSSLLIESLLSRSQDGEFLVRKIVGRDSLSILNFKVISPSDEISRTPILNGVSENTALVKNLINNERRLRNVSEIVIDSETTSVLRDIVNQKSSFKNTIIVTNSELSTSLSENRVYYNVLNSVQVYAQSDRLFVEGLMNIPKFAEELVSPNYSSIGIYKSAIPNKGYIYTLVLRG
jgi:hypothetical protein